MREGDQVRLISFNRTQKPCEPVPDNENYWKLVNLTGKVVKDPEEQALHAGFSSEKRFLVQFDSDLRNLGLICHNRLPNALWILECDIEKQQDG